MSLDLKFVKAIREKTFFGMFNCIEAVKKCGNDEEKIMNFLGKIKRQRSQRGKG